MGPSLTQEGDMPKLTNTDSGPRGVWTKYGLEYLDPGEIRDVEHLGDLPQGIKVVKPVEAAKPASVKKD